MPAHFSSGRLSAGLLLASLAGCGGGLFIGIGDRFDDSPPAVSLAAGATHVAAGQPVQFIAAASDENGIDEVAFFRLDGDGAVLLARDGAAPYELTVVAPADGRASLTVFARARDNEGNTADSAAVTVAVTP